MTAAQSGVLLDLLNYAVAIIEWREIAGHWLTDWEERQVEEA